MTATKERKKEEEEGDRTKKSSIAARRKQRQFLYIQVRERERLSECVLLILSRWSVVLNKL